MKKAYLFFALAFFLICPVDAHAAADGFSAYCNGAKETVRVQGGGIVGGANGLMSGEQMDPG